MLYWTRVLDELVHYRERSYCCSVTNLQDPLCFEDYYQEEEEVSPVEKMPTLQYFLRGDFAHIYLTHREAQCSYYLLQGHTIKQAGKALDLSPRTVEFYLKNIKKKLSLRKKTEVLSLLASMDIIDESVLYPHLTN
tara:strand:- start:2500 stop:2907 length:408 start_codon:yes stop_codon:yes gene_type:complete